LFIISLKGIDLKVVALWAIGGGLAALFVTMPSRPPIVTCYKPAPFGYRHRPEMAAKYQEQLEKYLKAGVIHPETYEKLKKAFDKDTATLPDWLKPPHAR
jgi:hypothetical protein